MVDTGPSAVEMYLHDKTFNLLKFTKDTKPIYYTTGKVNEIMEKVDDIAGWVDALLKDFLETTKPPPN